MSETPPQTAAAETCRCTADRTRGPDLHAPAQFRREPSAASFVTGLVVSGAGPVPQVATELTPRDHLGAWRVRWNIRRSRYRVEPGLWAVGTPDSGSEVLVTANYKLSFDALRSSLGGLDAWLLVLDTKGVNVWCAAGKQTFSTAEVARSVTAADLAVVVAHRRLILPQLGAPGTAAHEVRRACGFRVVFGPVCARDLPAFLAAGRKATPEMRTVTFTMKERLVLTPEVLSTVWRPKMLALYAAILAISALGPGAGFARAVTHGLPILVLLWLALLSGGVVTPLLLPWLPGRAFALKGALVGTAVALLIVVASHEHMSWYASAAVLLGLPAVASYVAMNFTGSTPFTSPSGVDRETRRALPLQAAALGLALAAGVATLLLT